MATQKNIKPSRSASKKAKPSVKAATKKASPKASAKGKTISKPSAVSKSKTSAKKAAGKVKKQVTTAKKASSVKTKSAPKKPILAKGKTTATKNPKVLKPALKPVKKPLLTAGKAPKSPGITKASPATQKPTLKLAPKVAGKLAPKKPAVAVGGSKHTTGKLSPAHSISGSKVTDKAGKQHMGSYIQTSKQAQPSKSKESTTKSSKPFASPTAKPFYKMTDKKEHRPIAATATTEEPHKTRYSDKELEEFDQLIDQKLIVAREQLEFYLKQLEDMAENPDNKIKGLDDGLSTLESERVSSMAARQQKLIQHLENAKIRIKNKVYGICRETGKLISKERLRAVPHATLSIEAKQAQN